MAYEDRNDPERSYRRGYTHGASDVIEGCPRNDPRERAGEA